jgi:hypothetical protein
LCLKHLLASCFRSLINSPCGDCGVGTINFMGLTPVGDWTGKDVQFNILAGTGAFSAVRGGLFKFPKSGTPVTAEFAY